MLCSSSERSRWLSGSTRWWWTPWKTLWVWKAGPSGMEIKCFASVSTFKSNCDIYVSTQAENSPLRKPPLPVCDPWSEGPSWASNQRDKVSHPRRLRLLDFLSFFFVSLSSPPLSGLFALIFPLLTAFFKACGCALPPPPANTRLALLGLLATLTPYRLCPEHFI